MTIFQNDIAFKATPLYTNPTEKKLLLDNIDKIPGLQGVRVLYVDGDNTTEIRPHPAMCQQSYLSVVVHPVTKDEGVKLINPTPKEKQEGGRFYQELLSSGLSCGAAALSWIAVAGSSAAIPVSGGTSTAITVLSWSAATASSLQCSNSLMRLYNETDYGDPTVNQWLDSQEWYEHTSTALDVVSLLGVAAATGATIKMVNNLRKAGTPLKQALQGLSRQQRKSLAEELIRAQNPGISNKALKALVAAGKYPKRFGKVEISKTLRLQLKDAIGASLSFAGSATGGVVRDPSKIPNMAIAVIEEFETY